MGSLRVPGSSGGLFDTAQDCRGKEGREKTRRRQKKRRRSPSRSRGTLRLISVSSSFSTALLEEKPLFLASFFFHEYEHVRSSQPGPLEVNEDHVRLSFHENILSAVPDCDFARSIPSFWDCSFERAVFQSMILHGDGKSLSPGFEGRPFWDSPGCAHRGHSCAA